MRASALALLLMATLAGAQTETVEDNTIHVFPAGVRPGPAAFSQLSATAKNGHLRYCTDCQDTNPCLAGGTGALARREGGVWNCGSGGGGGGGSGTVGLVSLSTCMILTGDVTVFVAGSTCADPVEAMVRQRVPSALALGNLSCSASASNASQSIAVRLRRQTGCSGSPVDQALTCTIPNGSATCSAAGPVGLSSGDCITFSVTPSATFVTPVQVNCLLERTT